MELAITKNKSRLEELEGVINRNLQSFYEVGRALMEIRDNELYKLKNGGGYGTFEAYCQDTWNFSRSHAYRFIDSVKVIENLSPTGDKPVTRISLKNTSHLPVLNRNSNAKEVWQKAVDNRP